jgi:hypothetical protein
MNSLQTTSHRLLGRIVRIAACVALVSIPLLAQRATFGQQVAVMKVLKADLKTVGVLSGNISDKATQDVTRAGLAQGITVVVAKAKDPREVAVLYKKLVTEKKIQMLWLPEAGDDLVMGVSMDYLKENTAMDRIGLVVPEKKMVAGGALCSVLNENSKLIVYVNKKMASVVGAVIPGEGSDINFVAQ